MKILYVDTETTGLINVRTSYDDLTVWPHVVQLSYMFDNSVTKVINTHTIKPEGFEIPEESTKVHGITDAFARENGEPLREAIEKFLSFLRITDIVVAHNTCYDMKVLKAELLRLGIDQHLRVKPWLDTMWYGNPLCRLKSATGRGKFPTLSELYFKLFGKLPEHVHNAEDDVRTLHEIFEELRKIGVMTDERITARILSSKS